MSIEEKTLKSQELTKLIGRRLREAVGGERSGLPAAIEEGLAAIRRAEARLRALGESIVDIDNATVGAGAGPNTVADGGDPPDASS